MTHAEFAAAVNAGLFVTSLLVTLETTGGNRVKGALTTGLMAAFTVG